jgi:hypothetical protein
MEKAPEDVVEFNPPGTAVVVGNVEELEVPKGTNFAHGDASSVSLLFTKTQKHEYLVEKDRVEH